MSSSQTNPSRASLEPRGELLQAGGLLCKLFKARCFQDHLLQASHRHGNLLQGSTTFTRKIDLVSRKNKVCQKYEDFIRVLTIWVGALTNQQKSFENQ